MPSEPPVSISKLRLALLIAISLAGFAANSLLCRLALAGTAHIDAISFTTMRVVSGAVVLVLLAGPRRALAQGSARGALALSSYAFMFSLAYVRIGAALGTLLLFGAVQLTTFSFAIARGERPGGRTWLGLGAALAGIAWLVAPGVGAPDPLGGALMVGAGTSWGIYSILGRGSTDALGATAGNFARSLVPAALLLLLGWRGSGLYLNAHGLALAIASGALASGVCYAVWYSVVPHIGTERVGIVQLATPILAALAAVPLLGEPLSARLLIAGFVVIGGVALAFTAPAAR